ncbi:MAG: CDP-glucose 4,6-dehydratase, partial [Cetobacterium sp.]
EPLSGYLLLGEKMVENPKKYCEGWNFGPNLDAIVPVWDVATKIVECYERGNLVDVSDPNALHEAKLLLLDITKARFELKWEPTLTIFDSIELTAEWYKRYKNEDVYKLCVEQIEKFVKYGEK